MSDLVAFILIVVGAMAVSIPLGFCMAVLLVVIDTKLRVSERLMTMIGKNHS